MSAWTPSAAPSWRVGLDGPLTARVTFATWADLDSFCRACADAKALADLATADAREAEHTLWLKGEQPTAAALRARFSDHGDPNV